MEIQLWASKILGKRLLPHSDSLDTILPTIRACIHALPAFLQAHLTPWSESALRDSIMKWSAQARTVKEIRFNVSLLGVALVLHACFAERASGIASALLETICLLAFDGTRKASRASTAQTWNLLLHALCQKVMPRGTEGQRVRQICHSLRTQLHFGSHALVTFCLQHVLDYFRFSETISVGFQWHC